MKNGLESSINAAVRRRDSLLALVSGTSPAPSSDPSPLSTSDPVSTADSASSGLSSPSSTLLPDTPSVPTSTSSQRIAQALLSGNPSSPSSLNTDMAKLAAALNNGIGIPGNPIAVTITERKYHIPSASSLATGAVDSHVVLELNVFIVEPRSRWISSAGSSTMKSVYIHIIV